MKPSQQPQPRRRRARNGTKAHVECTCNDQVRQSFRTEKQHRWYHELLEQYGVPPTSIDGDFTAMEIWEAVIEDMYGEAERLAAEHAQSSLKH